ncbi:MAG: hypothetical protein U0232_25730 [Thermomicrobiales bacterium]
MADGAPAILVVDDDPGFRELVAEVLSDEGYRPLAAAPADALAYAASQAARPGPARRPHARHRRPLALPPPARLAPHARRAGHLRHRLAARAPDPAPRGLRTLVVPAQTLHNRRPARRVRRHIAPPGDAAHA